jgi:hypothetical protein
MKAYTDEYIVKSDGIYRIEQIYTPGTGWERREVLWLPRYAAEAAQAAWSEKDDCK